MNIKEICQDRLMEVANQALHDWLAINDGEMVYSAVRAALNQEVKDSIVRIVGMYKKNIEDEIHKRIQAAFNGAYFSLAFDAVYAAGVVPTNLPELEDLGLSRKVLNRLGCAGIKDTKSLLERSEHDLKKIPNFGFVALNEIRDALSAHKLEIGQLNKYGS